MTIDNFISDWMSQVDVSCAAVKNGLAEKLTIISSNAEEVCARVGRDIETLLAKDVVVRGLSEKCLEEFATLKAEGIFKKKKFSQLFLFEIDTL